MLDIKISKVGKYLLFPSKFEKSMVAIKIYFVSSNGDLVKEIYELEQVKGMHPVSYEVFSDTIVISGTRVGSGSVFEYGSSYNICDQPVNILDKNIVLKADYTYSYSEKKINFEKVTKIKNLNLKDFLQDKYLYCE